MILRQRHIRFSVKSISIIISLIFLLEEIAFCYPSKGVSKYCLSPNSPFDLDPRRNATQKQMAEAYYQTILQRGTEDRSPQFYQKDRDEITKVKEWYSEIYEYAVKKYIKNSIQYKFMEKAKDPAKWIIHSEWGADLGLDEEEYSTILSKMTIPELVEEYSKLDPNEYVHKDLNKQLYQVDGFLFCEHLLGYTLQIILSYDDFVKEDPDVIKENPVFKNDALKAKKKMLLFREWAYRHWDDKPKIKSHLVFNLKPKKTDEDSQKSASSYFQKVLSMNLGFDEPKRIDRGEEKGVNLCSEHKEDYLTTEYSEQDKTFLFQFDDNAGRRIIFRFNERNEISLSAEYDPDGYFCGKNAIEENIDYNQFDSFSISGGSSNFIIILNFKTVPEKLKKFIQEHGPVFTSQQGHKLAIQANNIFSELEEEPQTKFVWDPLEKFKKRYGNAYQDVLGFLGVTEDDIKRIKYPKAFDTRPVSEYEDPLAKVVYKHTLLIEGDTELRQLVYFEKENKKGDLYMENKYIEEIGGYGIGPRAKVINTGKKELVILMPAEGLPPDKFEITNEEMICKVIHAIGFVLGKLHGLGFTHEDIGISMCDHIWLVHQDDKVKATLIDFGNLNKNNTTSIEREYREVLRGVMIFIKKCKYFDEQHIPAYIQNFEIGYKEGKEEILRLEAEDGEIESLITKIKGIKENEGVYMDERVIELKDFFQKHIVPLAYNDKLFKRILNAVLSEKPSTRARSNLIIIIGEFFGSEFLEKENFTITKAQYELLWQIYDACRFPLDKELALKNITRVLQDQRIEIFGDTEKEESIAIAVEKLWRSPSNLPAWSNLMLCLGNQAVDKAMQIMQEVRGEDTTLHSAIDTVVLPSAPGEIKHPPSTPKRPVLTLEESKAEMAILQGPYSRGSQEQEESPPLPIADLLKILDEALNRLRDLCFHPNPIGDGWFTGEEMMIVHITAQQIGIEHILMDLEERVKAGVAPADEEKVLEAIKNARLKLGVSEGIVQEQKGDTSLAPKADTNGNTDLTGWVTPLCIQAGLIQMLIIVGFQVWQDNPQLVYIRDIAAYIRAGLARLDEFFREIVKKTMVKYVQPVEETAESISAQPTEEVPVELAESEGDSGEEKKEQGAVVKEGVYEDYSIPNLEQMNFYDLRDFILNKLIGEGEDALSVDRDRLRDMIDRVLRYVIQDKDFMQSIGLFQESDTVALRMEKLQTGIIKRLRKKRNVMMRIYGVSPNMFYTTGNFEDIKSPSDVVYSIGANRQALRMLHKVGIGRDNIAFLIAIGVFYNQVIEGVYSSIPKRIRQALRAALNEYFKNHYKLDVPALRYSLELLKNCDDLFTRDPNDIAGVLHMIDEGVFGTEEETKNSRDVRALVLDLIYKEIIPRESVVIEKALSFFRQLAAHGKFASSTHKFAAKYMFHVPDVTLLDWDGKIEVPNLVILPKFLVENEKKDASSIFSGTHELNDTHKALIKKIFSKGHRIIRGGFTCFIYSEEGIMYRLMLQNGFIIKAEHVFPDDRLIENMIEDGVLGKGVTRAELEQYVELIMRFALEQLYSPIRVFKVPGAKITFKAQTVGMSGSVEGIVVLPSGKYPNDNDRRGWGMNGILKQQCWQGVSEKNIVNLLEECLKYTTIREGNMLVYRKGDSVYAAIVKNGFVLAFRRMNVCELNLFVHRICGYTESQRIYDILNKGRIENVFIPGELNLAQKDKDMISSILRGDDIDGVKVARSVFLHKESEELHIWDRNSHYCVVLNTQGRVKEYGKKRRKFYYSGKELKETYEDITDLIIEKEDESPDISEKKEDNEKIAEYQKQRIENNEAVRLVKMGGQYKIVSVRDSSEDKLVIREDITISPEDLKKIDEAKDMAVKLVYDYEGLRVDEDTDELAKIIQDTSLSLLLGETLVYPANVCYFHAGRGTKEGIPRQFWLGELLFYELTAQELAYALIEEARHILNPTKGHDEVKHNEKAIKSIREAYKRAEEIKKLIAKIKNISEVEKLRDFFQILESLSESDIPGWDNLVLYLENLAIDRAIQIMQDAGEETELYTRIYNYLLFYICPKSPYAKNRISKMIASLVKLNMTDRINTPEDALKYLFEDEDNAKNFLSLATRLRDIYFYPVSKDDPRPPLQSSPQDQRDQNRKIEPSPLPSVERSTVTADNIFEGWALLSDMIEKGLKDRESIFTVFIWGNSGAGKSTLCSIIRDYGIGKITPDQIDVYIENSQKSKLPDYMPKPNKRLVIVKGFDGPRWLRGSNLKADLLVRINFAHKGFVVGEGGFFNCAFQDLMGEDPTKQATWDLIINRDNPEDFKLLRKKLILGGVPQGKKGDGSDLVKASVVPVDKIAEGSEKMVSVPILEGVVYGETVGVVRIISDPIKGYKELFEIKENEIIVIPRYPTEDSTFARPMGIITSDIPARLSHAEVRVRFWGIPHAIVADIDELNNFNGKWMYMKVSENGVIFRLATGDEMKHWESFKPKMPKPELGPVDLTTSLNILPFEKAGNPAEVSYKFATLQKIFQVVEGGVIPYASYKKIIDLNPGAEEEIRRIAASINNSDIDDIKEKLNRIKKIIENLEIPEATWGNAQKENPGPYAPWSIDYAISDMTLSGEKGVFIRTGTNAEDLPDYPGFGAGQYGTFANIKREDVKQYVKKAWASVWNLGAYIERQKLGIDHFKVYPAVQIAPAIDAQYAFVAHTAHPDGNNTNLMVLEIVQGLGEGLVSDKHPGNAYRYVYDKKKDKIIEYTPATKTEKVILDPNGGTKVVSVDYSDDIFAKEGINSQEALGLARMVIEFEKGFDRPQDIEGMAYLTECDEVLSYVFCQSRSQVGYGKYPTAWDVFYKEHIDWAMDLVDKAEPYFNNERLYDTYARQLMNYNFLNDIKANINRSGIRIFTANLLRLFDSIGPKGKQFIKLIFAYSSGLHKIWYEALQKFDSNDIAQFLDAGAININKFSYASFNVYKNSGGLMIMTFFCGNLILDCKGDILKQILKQVRPETLAAIINEATEYYYRNTMNLIVLEAKKRVKGIKTGEIIRDMFLCELREIAEDKKALVISGLSKSALLWLGLKEDYVKNTVNEFLLNIEGKLNNCKDLGDELVLAVDTDIGNLRLFAQELLDALGKLQEELNKKGFNNVRIFVGSGEELEQKLKTYIREKGDKKNYIISAVMKYENIKDKKVFKEIKNKVQITAVNDEDMKDKSLVEAYYIPIIGLLQLSLEKAVGKKIQDIQYDLANIPNVVDISEEDGMFIIRLLPNAKPMAINELREMYSNEAKTLISA